MSALTDKNIFVSGHGWIQDLLKGLQHTTPQATVEGGGVAGAPESEGDTRKLGKEYPHEAKEGGPTCC